jgi:hypothetical protein
MILPAQHEGDAISEPYLRLTLGGSTLDPLVCTALSGVCLTSRGSLHSDDSLDATESRSDGGRAAHSTSSLPRHRGHGVRPRLAGGLGVRRRALLCDLMGGVIAIRPASVIIGGVVLHGTLVPII